MLRSPALKLGRRRDSGFEGTLEGRHDGCAKFEVGVGRSWLLLRGGGGVVVVLSVVGRVLMQVGCKKFATTPRSIQFETTDFAQRAPRFASYQALRYRVPLEIALGKPDSSKRSVQSIYSFAPGKVLSSRLVLSRSSHQTDFRSFHLLKVKSCLRRQTDGLVPCWSPLELLM